MLLAKSALTARPLQAADTEEGVGTDSQREHSEWADMDSNDVIEKGVISNSMLTVQQYLSQRGHRQKAGHSAFIHASLQRTLKYLHNQEIESAKQLLSSLGFSVAGKLWEFVLFSRDVRQRDFTLRELKKLTALTTEQSSVLEFYNLLSEAYTELHGKEMAEIQTAKDSRLWEKTADVSECLPDSPSRILRVGSGETRRGSPADHVLFDWLLHWNFQRRQRILLDASGKDISLTDFDSTVLWDYFLSHCNRKVLQDWLEFSFLGDSVRHDQMQTLPPLAADIIEDMDNCPDYLRQILQDQCARYGVFSKADLECFPLFLSQLVRVGSVMRTPHPLQDSAYLSLSHFHPAFLKYCCTENLPSLMWTTWTITALILP
ncbi:spatacsin-like [Liolophura sinensis]|uniref:spatacsin-like n=1 Tax=Liolophura sinensis TaxID=3198878 RepID=UPI003158C4B2